eukprot:CAMPEP_0179071902 /NCGR_PEP_ID=MMETSP0796-20121207/31775_1 /TAXON_ID=73915 /ORGANISM="Pyrodinium bahamense, Strain pbaha01" /LENGTH=236 /DNA_ID=CAMNT_0020769039 /DNA_START=58 /DNA_END=764 /DNA_ORIENTATION=+
MNFLTSSGSVLQMPGRFMITSCARLERVKMIWFSLLKDSTFPVCFMVSIFLVLLDVSSASSEFASPWAAFSQMFAMGETPTTVFISISHHVSSLPELDFHQRPAFLEGASSRRSDAAGVARCGLPPPSRSCSTTSVLEAVASDEGDTGASSDGAFVDDDVAAPRVCWSFDGLPTVHWLLLVLFTLMSLTTTVPLSSSSSSSSLFDLAWPGASERAASMVNRSSISSGIASWRCRPA